MQRTFATGLGVNASIAAGIYLALIAVSPQPATAQQLWAAIAISPSTLKSGDSHAATTQDRAVSLALQYCAVGGAKDCKVIGSVANACLALATPPTAIANEYGYGAAATRSAAAAIALSECAKTGAAHCAVYASPCAPDDPRWSSPLPLPLPLVPPLSVDPGLVGIWQTNMNGGIWVWQLAANGTYTFADETSVNSAPTNGSFGAGGGKYTLHSYVSVWDDQGTYTIQPGGNSVVFSGKLGTNTWTRSMYNPFTTAPAR